MRRRFGSDDMESPEPPFARQEDETDGEIG
jgi:hypothetical protein